MHTNVMPLPYANPLFRLVYGFPLLPASLHRLRNTLGQEILHAMTDQQCDELLKNQMNIVCVQWTDR